MFKQLVADQSCGVINPLTQMAQQANAMNATLADAKAFSGQQQQSQVESLAQMAAQGQSLQHQGPMDLSQMGPDPNQIMTMNANPMMVRQHSMPVNPLQQQNNMHGQQLANQFRQQMQMNNQQAMQFDNIYNNLQQQPAQLNRAQSQQPVYGRAAQMNQMPQQQPMFNRAQSSQMQHQQHMMQYQQMMQQSQMMQQQQQQFNPMMAQQQQVPTMMQQQQQPVLQRGGLDGKQTAVDPLAATSVEAPQQSMSGGLDSAMMEAFKNSSNPKWKNSKFIKFVDQVNSGKIKFEDNAVVAVPPSEQVSLLPAPVALAEDGEDIFADQELNDEPWVQEFMQHQQQNQQGANWEDNQEFLAQSQEWMQAVENAKAAALDAQKDPTYEFMTPATQDDAKLGADELFRRGCELLKNGRLKAAIKTLENTVRAAPEHADAWAKLGQARAENEDESAAIAALLKAIELDPYHLDALMMLGVSYTNDLESQRALGYLKTWLLHHPDYQSSSLEMSKQSINEYEQFYGDHASDHLDDNLHSQVTNMFLNAIRIKPTDPDIHEVLGVLYHLSNDFDKAIDSFKISLQLNPENAQVWNKLGATQANSDNSKEAVYAYRRALKLKPTYVRALANLAISFANQGMHKDAARTYLATLKQNPQAEHIWSYLRISLTHLNKPALVSLVSKRDASLFKEHFKF